MGHLLTQIVEEWLVLASPGLPHNKASLGRPQRHKDEEGTNVLKAGIVSWKHSLWSKIVLQGFLLSVKSLRLGLMSNYVTMSLCLTS